jgi:WD40 repeat protein
MSLPALSRHRLSAALLLAPLVASASAFAAETTPADKHVESAMILLRDECLRCHKPDKKKGGLLLNSRQALLEGGDTGPAIVSGQAAKSLLVESLSAEADPHMPPKEQLTAKQIALFEQWINQGAGWDAETLAKVKAPPYPKATELAHLPDSYRPILAMAVSPDAKTLAAAAGGDVILGDIIPADPKQKTKTSLKASTTLPAHKDAVQSLTWTPDGKRFASGAHREIRIWQIGKAEPLFTLSDKLKGRITALVASPDSKTLIAADSIPAVGADLHIVDLASGKILRSIEYAHRDSIFGISLSPDKKHFATVSADKLVKIWDLQTLKPLVTLEGHTGFVLAAAFSPTGDRIASAGDDQAIKVWNVETKKQLMSFGAANTGAVTGLRWIEDQEKLKKKAAEKDPKKADSINTDKIFAISEDGQPRVYGDLVQHDGAQSSTGAKEKAYTAQKESLASLAVADAGEGAPPLLIAGSDSGSLFIWDDAGKLVFQSQPDSKLAESAPAKK